MFTSAHGASISWNLFFGGGCGYGERMRMRHRARQLAIRHQSGFLRLNSSSNGVESSTGALADGHLRAIRYTAYKMCVLPPVTFCFRCSWVGRRQRFLSPLPPSVYAASLAVHLQRRSGVPQRWERAWSRPGAASTNWRVELTKDQAGLDEWNEASAGCRREKAQALQSCHTAPQPWELRCGRSTKSTLIAVVYGDRR